MTYQIEIHYVRSKIKRKNFYKKFTQIVNTVISTDKKFKNIFNYDGKRTMRSRVLRILIDYYPGASIIVEVNLRR